MIHKHLTCMRNQNANMKKINIFKYLYLICNKLLYTITIYKFLNKNSSKGCDNCYIFFSDEC